MYCRRIAFVFHLVLTSGPPSAAPFLIAIPGGSPRPGVNSCTIMANSHNTPLSTTSARLLLAQAVCQLGSSDWPAVARLLATSSHLPDQDKRVLNGEVSMQARAESCRLGAKASRSGPCKTVELTRPSRCVQICSTVYNKLAGNVTIRV